MMKQGGGINLTHQQRKNIGEAIVFHDGKNERDETSFV